MHGVIVHSPELAAVLRRAGWFSGYAERLRDLPDGTVVFRDDVGPLAGDPGPRETSEGRRVRD